MWENVTCGRSDGINLTQYCSQGYGPGSIKNVLVAMVLELRSVLILKRRVLPFSLRFEEECEGIAAEEWLDSGFNTCSERNHPICTQFVTALCTPIMDT